jgi:hypothetical protein
MKQFFDLAKVGGGGGHKVAEGDPPKFEIRNPKLEEISKD